MSLALANNFEINIFRILRKKWIRENFFWGRKTRNDKSKKLKIVIRSE